MKPIVNVSKAERIVCAVIAGWILVGLLRGRRRSLGKVMLLGSLVYRAGTGNCKGYEALGACKR